jgi:uroporphyrinogen decarboxylase
MLETPVTIDFEEMLRTIRREGTPSRVHFMELFLDPEVQDAIDDRYGVSADLDRNDPHYGLKRYVALQRFLGYDHVSCTVEGIIIAFKLNVAEDTAEVARDGGRNWMEERSAVITSWEDFEKFDWPDVNDIRTDMLDWFEANLPDDMCVIGHCGHFCETLTWIMGYETLCYALYDQRDLVEAIRDKIWEIEKATIEALLQFDRVRAVWGSDDMGFKTGLMVSAADMREFVLEGHKKLARMAHDAGRLYLLHACGNLSDIMDDLIDDVKIDAKHSFEDTIEPVTDAKRAYGDRLSLIGGIDVNFLCLADEPAIRRRVRETLEVCQPGGGYLLGTGNSVANYIPVDNYLAMLDEGRKFS